MPQRQVGLLSAGIASSLGLAAIVAASSLAYELLRWGGAFYLLWLAWEGWRDAPEGVGKSVDMSSHKEFFLKGFITNLLNPKAGIFYLSVFPAVIDDDRSLLAQTAILLAVYVTIATVIHSGVVISADAIRPILENQGNATVIRRMMCLTGFGRGVASVHDTQRGVLAQPGHSEDVVDPSGKRRYEI